MFKSFACIGSLNVDINFSLDRLPAEHEKLRTDRYDISYGGAAANTAYWLARLGAETKMIGFVGDDEIANGCIASLQNVGVNTQWIGKILGRRTGIAVVLATGDQKRMITAPGPVGEICDENSADLMRYVNGASHVHTVVSALRRAPNFFRSVAAAGISISCDMNGEFKPNDAEIPDLIFVNHTDLFRSLGMSDVRQAASALKLRTDRRLIVTIGKEGSEIVDGDAAAFGFKNPYPCDPLDRTGGGDAFISGVLWAMSVGCQDDSRLLATGHALASQVIAGLGARPENVNLDLVRKFIEER
jgi:sugar/nucleoside kinase (ribokinase family)